jgi:DNA polymerase kappa
LIQKDLKRWALIQKDAEKELEAIRKRRDLTRTWIHVDMDMFYAAVEMLDNPVLKDKPMAVGTMKMISTANYKAREFGVKSAMPGFIAL